MPSRTSEIDNSYLSNYEQILKLSYSCLVQFMAIYSAAELRIPDALGDHIANADELAWLISANPGALRQLLRVLTRAGVCTESGDGRYSLTPLGAALRSDAPNSMRGWVMLAGSHMYLRMWEQLSYSVRTGKPGFDRAHGAPAFEYFSKHPEAQSIFDAAMTAVSGPEAQALVAAYDFSASRRVVDVGGGHGALLVRILKANPHLRGAVFEQPQVLDGARSNLKQHGLLERCDLIEGSFFESVPGGYDTYVLKYIVHDWNDEKASQILRNCRRVFGNESKLVLMESVISRTSTDLSIMSDFEMLAGLGSKERSEEEFRVAEGSWLRIEADHSDRVPFEHHRSDRGIESQGCPTGERTKQGRLEKA